MKSRNVALALAIVLGAALSPVGTVQQARADLPGFILRVWQYRWGGLWRTEYRKREIARWYRHYHWLTDQRLWLKRRAEGVWITGAALQQFSCHGHCVIQSPNGRGIWRIWRWYSRVDVRRFRAHYRILWPGWVNGVMLGAAPPGNIVGGLNARFQMTMDHLEIVTPMEPADPNPGTPLNEAVMIMDENGQMHLLGEPGFEQMPDTAGNPNGFTIASTAVSSLDLPPASQRTMETPMSVPPGMIELQPGVIIQWLVNESGQVVAEHDGLPGPDPILSDGILGGQKHQALLGQPTGTDGFELDMDEGNVPLQMHCWMLAPNGEVVGAAPGQIVIGPPRDADGIPGIDPQTAFGGPIPMNPTVRDDDDVLIPGMAPVDFGIVEEDAPTPAEVAALNVRLQQAGIPPVQPPFQLCIRSVRARHIWGIDRRFVMDCWRHHWTWFIAQHITLTSGTHRVWLTKTALEFFSYSGHHFVAGLPPQWRMLTLTNLRFFRVCYRVYCPSPGVARIKIEQVYAVLPVDPNNPNSDLMLLTTQSNENALFQEVPAPVLAGLQPDPLPVGPDGVFVQTLSPVLDTLDMGGGGTGIFDGNVGAIPPNGTMTEVTMVGNNDFAQAMRNNQLQLYCWALNPNGTIKQTTFVVECSQGQSCQLDDEQGHGAGNVVGAVSNPFSSFVVADNFRTATDHPIRHVCWWGGYYNPSAGSDCSPGLGPDQFTITYYNDAGGLPGAVRAGPFPVGATKNDTGRIINPGGLNLHVFSYGADHPPVSALPGECLWISIQNNISPSCTWFWNSAPPGDGRGVSNLTSPVDYDFAFCLDVPTAGLCSTGARKFDLKKMVSDMKEGRTISADPDGLQKLFDQSLHPDWTPGDALSANDPGDRGILPANDECAFAIGLSVPAFTSGFTAGASADPSAPGCGTSVTAPGVWYSVVGNGTTLTATTCNPGTNYDSKINVYCGSCANLVCVGGNDDDATCAVNGLHSRVSWCSEAGRPYFILVQGFNGEVGSFDLSLTSNGLGCTASPCLPVAAIPRTITFTEDPAPALPAFEDDQGNPMPNPTMTSFIMSAEPAVPICCVGNGDKIAPGIVNFADITATLANWTAPPNPNGTSTGDADCNGAINFADITAELANWLSQCP